MRSETAKTTLADADGYQQKAVKHNKKATGGTKISRWLKRFN